MLGMIGRNPKFRMLHSVPAWPNGADGALVINGTTVSIPAGAVKDYSSISIINNGILEIQGQSLGVETNDGTMPTIIGCSGNCTINTGGLIRARQNALAGTDIGAGPWTYMTVSPTGAVVPMVSFSIVQSQGGSSDSNTDSIISGHGAGGSTTLNPGTEPISPPNWGESGFGGEGDTGAAGGGGISALLQGFGIEGNFGGNFEQPGDTHSGGGGGAVRALHGGCVYLQVAGTLTVSGQVIDVSGQDGANGGSSGNAISDPIGDAYSGNSGGGSAGGSAGKVIVRYKLGAFSAANCNVAPGLGGSGGSVGLASAVIGSENPGVAGTSGSDGSIGSTDIATY